MNILGITAVKRHNNSRLFTKRYVQNNNELRRRATS